MEIGIKDGLFVVIYLVTVVTLWNGFHSDIMNNAKDISTNSDDIQKLSDLFKKVMFSETGDVLLTTKRDCEKINREMSDRIEAGRISTGKAFDKIEKINQNIIRIMCHLKIDETNVLYQSGRHDKND